MVCNASTGEMGPGRPLGLLPASLVYLANELQANKRPFLKKKMAGSYGMTPKVVLCLLHAQAHAHTCTTPTMEHTHQNKQMNDWGLER